VFAAGALAFTARNLNGAILIRTNFYRANLTDADLTEANLTDADLTRAKFFGADLTRAKWPEDVRVPEGWKLDTGTGRLRAADTGAEATEASPKTD
jgi:uncharacterized protein YjbI with pentapeptide repeats